MGGAAGDRPAGGDRSPAPRLGLIRAGGGGTLRAGGRVLARRRRTSLLPDPALGDLERGEPGHLCAPPRTDPVREADSNRGRDYPPPRPRLAGDPRWPLRSAA